MRKTVQCLVICVLLLAVLLTACQSAKSDFVLVADWSAKEYLGEDCNSGLLKQFRDQYKVCVTPVYKTGVELNSLQLAALAGNNALEADAFLADDGVWLSENLKETVKIAETNIVFGIDSGKVAEIGWEAGSSHTIGEGVAMMNDGALQTVVCNANQCNSGAMFFTGVVSSIKGNTGNPVVLDDFQNEDVIKTSKEFYKNVSRSGSSELEAAQIYLQDKINNANLYDALVTYEPVGAETNKALLAAGKNPLIFFYLYDANVVTSPTMGYLDNGDVQKEEVYAQLSDFLKSTDSQTVIADAGWRPVIYGLKANQSVLKPEWGFLSTPVVEYIPVPKRSVMTEAIKTFALYYKKPADIVMCLDNSGSMQENGGFAGLQKAVGNITDLGWLTKNQLYPSENDSVSIFIFGGNTVLGPVVGIGNKQSDLTNFRDTVYANMGNLGGTPLYECARIALDQAIANQKPDHNTMVVLMTDGQSNTGWVRSQFLNYYKQTGTAIPIYAIAFGADASSELGYKDFGRYTNGLYFDGADLVEAFTKIWGGS